MFNLTASFAGKSVLRFCPAKLVAKLIVAALALS